MPFYSMGEDAYWDQMPALLKHLQPESADHLRVVYFVLGDDADPESPTVAVLEMNPGCVITRHAHTCERFEIVVKGTLDVGARVLNPGDVMISHAGAEYGPHTAGPEGCTTLEVFGTYEGSYTPLYPGRDGPVMVDYSNPGGGARKAEAIAPGNSKLG
jgi:hypothetical protein